MNGREAGRCPVCQARFRGAGTCSRCGADLYPLMLLMAQAYSLRAAARQSLTAGDTAAALASADAAQSLHATPEGEVLRLVCAAAMQGGGSSYVSPQA